jgi:hypothetical protein
MSPPAQSARNRRYLAPVRAKKPSKPTLTELGIFLRLSVAIAAGIWHMSARRQRTTVAASRMRV